jgi:hypothetical protein
VATILSLIQDFCLKKGLASPSGLVGNTDLTYQQLLAMCHAVVEDAATSPWQDQVKRVTFVSIAAEVQGSISTLFGAGYRKLIPGTLYNVTQLLSILGPIVDQDWNELLALQAGPRYQFKIMGGNLHVAPTLPAGDTIAAMVTTNYVIQDSGGNAKERFTADTDVPLLPSNFFKMDLEWRWLREQGQAFAKLQQEAYWLKAGLVVKDGHLPDLHLDQRQQTATPGIIVPQGNWNV